MYSFITDGLDLMVDGANSFLTAAKGEGAIASMNGISITASGATNAVPDLVSSGISRV